MFSLKYIPALLATSVVFLTVQSSFASGHESSGGGTVVFKKDGAPVLTDLLSSEDIENNLASPEQAKIFYNGYHARFLKRPITLDSGKSIPDDVRADILNCGYKAVQSFSESLRQSMDHLGNRQDILNIELFHYPLPAPDQRGRFSLPPTVKISSTVRQDLQFPVARFYDIMVDLDYNLFQALSQPSRCALGIHEWIRDVTQLGILSEDLSTDEIEEFTRKLLGQSARNPTILSMAIDKMNNPRYYTEVKPHLKKIRELLKQLEIKVGAAALHDENMIIKIKRKAILVDEMAKTAVPLYFKIPEMNQIINRFSKEIEALRDMTLPGDSQKDQLDLIFDILNEASNMQKVTGFEVDRMNVFLFERPNKDLFYKLYLNHLKPFQWFDAVSEQVVTRAIP